MNPVNLRKKVFSISSVNREDQLSVSNPFDITIDMPRANKFNQISCLIAEIPRSWYMIDSTNNTFTIDAGATTVTLTPGRDYSATEFAAEVQAALILADGAGWTVTFDTDTSKYTITGPGAWVWDGDTNSALISKYLGLPRVSLADTGFVIVSPNVINLSRYDYLRIRSDMCLNNNDDVLTTIFPNSFSQFSVINYTNDSAPESSVSLANNHSNRYRFTLVDNDNKPVNLNGLDWQLVLVGWEQK